MTERTAITRAMVGDFDTDALRGACTIRQVDEAVARLLLTYLAWRGGSDGLAFEQVSGVAESLGQPVRKVERAMSALTDAGLVEPVGWRHRVRLRRVFPSSHDTGTSDVDDGGGAPSDNTTSVTDDGGQTRPPTRLPTPRPSAATVRTGTGTEPTPGGAHKNTPNVGRAVADLNLDPYTQQVIALCHELDGDPWRGYLLVRQALSTLDIRDPSLRDPMAVLRHRLGLSAKRATA